MAVQLLVTRPVLPVGNTGTAALTDKGAAAAALLRFERLLRGLGPADRRWFAGELAGLAREAEGA